MSKHTPGPWSVRKALGLGDLAIVAPSTQPDHSGFVILAECYEDIRDRGEHAVDECAANARLIAAAPDLLEALQDMVSDHADLSEATLRFARAAIAKATT